jgi:hypothetical protein
MVDLTAVQPRHHPQPKKVDEILLTKTPYTSALLVQLHYRYDTSAKTTRCTTQHPTSEPATCVHEPAEGQHKRGSQKEDVWQASVMIYERNILTGRTVERQHERLRMRYSDEYLRRYPQDDQPPFL